jgi:hypothetical protein
LRFRNTIMLTLIFALPLHECDAHPKTPAKHKVQTTFSQRNKRKPDAVRTSKSPRSRFESRTLKKTHDKVRKADSQINPKVDSFLRGSSSTLRGHDMEME